MPDPRSPVVVGVGQVAQRVAATDARAPIDLLADACRLADADAHATQSLLDRVDVIGIAAIGSWPYPDPGALLARTLGIAPRATLLSTVGGNSPQLLVERARGRASSATSSTSRSSAARKRCTRAGGRGASREVAPHVGLRRRRAVRVDDRRQPARRQRLRVGALGARAAARVPAVRDRAARGRGPHGRRAPAPRERAVGALRRGRGRRIPTRGRSRRTRPRRSAPSRPTTAWCASRTRSACAPTSTSTRPRRCCSAPTRPRTPRACPTTAWCSCTRPRKRTTTTSSANGGRSPTRPASRPRSATRSRRPASRIDDVARFDLYSCFPSAVQVAMRALGLADDDPRPLTVTGGLGLRGRAGQQLPDPRDRAHGRGAARRSRRSFGCTTALGWYISKHAAGVWSATPPAARLPARRPRDESGQGRRAPRARAGRADRRRRSRSKPRRSRSSATAHRRSASSPRSPPTAGGRSPTSVTTTR